MTTRVRSFASFAGLIARSLDLGSIPEPEDLMQADLRLDSLALFELYVVLDEMGVDIEPEVLADPDVTIGALYDRAVLEVVDRDLSTRQHDPT